QWAEVNRPTPQLSIFAHQPGGGSAEVGFCPCRVTTASISSAVSIVPARGESTIVQPCARPSYQGSALAYPGRGTLASPVVGSVTRSSTPNTDLRRSPSKPSRARPRPRKVPPQAGSTETMQRRGRLGPSEQNTQSRAKPFPRGAFTVSVRAQSLKNRQ